MKKKKYILLIIISVLFWNCNTYKPISNLKGQIIKGKIVNGETDESIVGLSIYEYGRTSNMVLTDTLGNFEIETLGFDPIIEITGFGESIFVTISPDKFNNIVLDSNTIRTSKKMFNKVSKFKKNERRKFSHISLDGEWEVIEINRFVNPRWKYLDEMESNFTNRKLKKLFPCKLNENSILRFKPDKKLIVNSENKYKFRKGEKFLSVYYKDVVFMYEYKFQNENTLSFRKEINFGESEWIIKRK